MSYDLLFSASTDHGHEDFKAHFLARPHYSVNAHQAWYSNDDTGAYFSFDFVGREERTEVGPDVPPHWASFNLELRRPHFFASEAAIEVAAFLTRFPGDAIDPQGDDTAFSPASFTANWMHHNQLAAEHTTADVHFYDHDALHRIWRWNYERSLLQQHVGRDADVPHIAMYRHEGSLVSGALWSDAAPTVLPRTDVVLLGRIELAPRRLFRKKPTVAVVRWSDVEPHLAHCRTERTPIEHRFPEESTVPPAVKSWFCRQPATKAVEGIAFDQVLDRAPLAAGASA